MKYGNIGMICPYEKMSWQALAISRDLGIRLEVEVASLDEALPIAHRLIEEKGVEVIISRGGTTAVLRKKLNIPIVSADPTAFDILQTLYSAKELHLEGSIGLATYGNLNFEINMFGKILGKNLEIINFYNSIELIRKLEEACENGIHVIAGGDVAHRYASSFGMKSFLITSNIETIMKSIREAQDITFVRREEKKNAEFLGAILNSTHDGIVAVSEDGAVTVFNPAAEKLLNIEGGQVLGHNIDKELPMLGLKNTLENRQPEFAVLQKLENRQLVISKVPIEVNREISGVVCILQDYNSLQKVEQKVRKELRSNGLVAKFKFSQILGQCQPMQKVLEMARCFAQTDATVLINGETGVGKELFAQSIHNYSKRQKEPFVAINCAALPETLLESELFGYAEGAFTGAKKGGKPGLFQLAHKGTIFLDEIDRMPLALQSRLLRVIQEREVMPVGGDSVIRVDVRIISTTKNDLWSNVLEGKFQEDLYFRLNVLNLFIPSLRNRKEDIALLGEYFIRRFSLNYNKTVPFFSEKTLKMLHGYQWMGNVRELENFCERYCLLYDKNLSQKDVVLKLLFQKGQEMNKSLQKDNELTVRIATLQEMEYQIIAKLSKLVENKLELAKLLNISRSTLWKKLKELESVRILN